jgi:O-acetyl-ADP-ribose deacetylase (regulator of RNase III)
MSSFKIVNGSCADMEVDAVVNAANRNLLPGAGICGAIFKKCGYEKLEEACRKIDTPLKDGDAVITPAFDMTNAKYIIHAVGPNFGITKEAFNELYLAYFNSLLILMYNNLHSISFPLISSGIFGGNLSNPAKISTDMCKKAYEEFIKEYNDYDIDVILCAYTKEEYEIVRGD